MNNTKSHWETVYNTKQPNEVSWTQDKPQTSLSYIQSLNLPKKAAIIDIGGGDSRLVDNLIELGYRNVTVLDISESALERARQRLGNKADLVKWLAIDITEFEPQSKYDVWHDRATFHFMTTEYQISQYIRAFEVSGARHLFIGSFSKDGPTKCSGLDIKQYDPTDMQKRFGNFEMTAFTKEDHITPFGTKQNFVFCSFDRKEKLSR
ncbi:class I SAM-dependent methyltransferase [Polluticoccus soli]|uniref:class I SAM-dependent methyltransferase n=1 Tax=Polluticoccus soli TaxID=3034150 RepID=UPI0023E2E050|nr:class I SAM-dependent methyltransferase [Flavipsychrobacter sp. JY13-12]